MNSAIASYPRSLLCAVILSAVEIPVAVAATPPPIRDMVGLDQHLDAQLPLDARLRDSSGETVALRDVVRDRPAVLLFGYFTCAQLCGVTSDGVLDALRQMQPSVGRDYDFVYVSIDPADTPLAAHEKLDRDALRYGRGDDRSGWHYLTGDAETIARITSVAGFRFQKISGARLFAHPSGFLIVRADGVIARYFPGVDFRPAEISVALRDAAAGRTGNRVFDLLLVCISGGLRSGASRWAFLAVQIAAGLTVVTLASGIVHMLRAERRRASAQAPGPTS